MRVTFLAHDGFFIELDQVCLLFDWWKGVLPPLPDKPLLVSSATATRTTSIRRCSHWRTARRTFNSC